MIGPIPQTSLRKRYAGAALAGVILALSYPMANLAALAWAAPGLMLALTLGQPGGNTFRLGYVAGLSYHLCSLYWLLYIPVRFAPVAGWVALSGFLALYQGAWVWLCWRLYPLRLTADGRGPVWPQFLSNPWPHQLLWTLTCAASWVMLEMIQARLLGGFPWNLLGASQFRLTPLIQIASLTGVYGLSFVMVWFSTALISAMALVVFRPERPRDWMVEMMPPLFAVTLVLAFGMRQVFYAPQNQPTLKISLVQPSIPQTVIWDPAQSQARFNELIELSEAALTNRPDLLIWPEAAVPNLLRYDTNTLVTVTNLVRRHGVWLILGAEDVTWRPGPEGNEQDVQYWYYNCSFLITPEGQLDRLYRKRKLVMFGEYVPLARWLPFLRDFTSVTGDFSPGPHPVPFLLPDLGVRTSVLICFEDVFPHLAREYVQDDTDFLVNLTNNGWFGESAAQWQHAANAVFRAVENGLPLVRCANNGVSCWVDPYGRMHSAYFPGTRDTYGRGVKTVRVPLHSLSKSGRTVYSRHGDWFGWACVAWSVLALLRRALGRVR